MKQILSRSLQLLTLIFVLLAWSGSPAHAANTGQFTAEVWVKPESSAASKAILGKAEEVRIFTDASGYAGCQIKVTSWQTAATATTNALALNTWSHVACAYDKANIKIYVNGVQMASTALTSAPDDTAAVWKLGQDDSASTPYGNLNGTVDDFRFYDYARTNKQIVEDMNAGHPAVGSPVGSAVGYWKFDEGYGATANNSGNGGSALNGTLTPGAGGTNTTAAAMWDNAGKYSKAMEFDGTDDYVVTSSNITLTNSFSYSAWVNVPASWIDDYPSVVSVANNADLLARHSGVSNKAHFQVNYNSTWYSANSNSALSQGWHHLVGILNTTDSKVYLYLDGVLQGTATGPSSFSLTNTINIGKLAGSAAGDFNGTIDEVKIYNYALTSDEVKTEYNSSSAVSFGRTSTESDGTTPSSSSSREYCIPGDTTSCAAPVAEWKFDEGSGTTANDTSGNSNTGTLTAGPTWAAGKIGKGLSFDGSDDNVTLANSSTTSPGTGSFSVGAWFRTSTTGSSQYIYWDSVDSSNAPSIQFYVASDNKLACLYRDASSNQVLISAVGNSVTDGSWHYATCIRDGTTGRLYLDGIQIGTNTNASLGTIDVSTGRIPRIGGASTGVDVLSAPFNGQIDDVRVYNYARTAAQIAWDYNRGGPVGWWKMDECQGVVVHNSADPAVAGSGLDGTLTIGASGTQTSAGTCSSGVSTQAWNNGASGKFNSSLNFDGSDDYVNVSDSTNLRVESAPFTVEAWIKPSTVRQQVIIFKSAANFGTAGWGLLMNRLGSDITLTKMGVADQAVSYTFSSNVWYHVVAVQGASSVQYFINGGSIGTYSNASAYQSSTGQDLRIGGGNTFMSQFDGAIDQVRIYNYALTATQIKDLYNGGAVRFGPASGSP